MRWTKMGAAGIGLAGAALALAAAPVAAEVDDSEIEDSLRALADYAETASDAAASGAGEQNIDAEAYSQQVEQLDAVLDREGASSAQLEEFRQRAERIGQEHGILE